MLWVSGEQQKNSAVHIHVSILPQTPLPSRLPHNTEQRSLCCTVGPCWLSILNIAVRTVHPKLPNYFFPASFPLATISSFSKSVSLFLSTFICTISVQIPHIRAVIRYFSFSVWLTSLSVALSRAILVAANCIILFFYGWLIYCIFVPHLFYPFLCWWTFRVLPCLGYCKQCCDYLGACCFSDHVFLQLYAQEWNCRVIE